MITQAEISVIQKDTELPRIGISQIKLSFDNNFVATISETSPTCVWIWDIVKGILNSLIVQKNRITQI